MSRERRLVFGEVAELYDRARPTYPPELFGLIYDYAGLSNARAGTRVLEIGAGTGKATMVLAPTAAEHGWTLDCVEPDPAMAAILEQRLASVDDLTSSVEVSGFEDWTDRRAAAGTATPFDLVFTAQAFHWLKRERRFADCATALVDDGTLALIWNVGRPHPPGLKEAIDAAYAEAIPEGDRPSSPHPAGAGWSSSDRVALLDEIRQSELFGDPTEVSVAWIAPHTTDEWIDVIQTHSDHRILEPDVRDRVLESVRSAVDANGGRLDVEYDAVALLARRTPR